MSGTTTHDFETLLSHAQWVRDLARSLTADAASADDLAQDTLAAALVRPPPAELSPRRWLAGILHNLARERRRRAGRRAARERAVAREEADLASAQLLERLDLHRTVVEAVVRLDETYRDVVLMRYFEGLSPSAIAARTGTPLRTVHTRLHRALQKLRGDLDRKHAGDRAAWTLALLPLARETSPWTSAAIVTLTMDAKLKLALAAIVVVGVVTTLALRPGSSEGVSPDPLAGEPAPAVLAREEPRADPTLEPAAETVARTATAPAPAAAQIEPPPAAARAALRGKVIDADRNPVAGVEVRAYETTRAPIEGAVATTDALGAFTIERELSTGYLDVATAGWAAVLRPEFFQAPLLDREFVVVVARSVRIAGVVVDPERRPLDAATVSVPFPFGIRSRFDAILDYSSAVERTTRTGADGRFELADVPLVPGFELVTSRPTYLDDRRALPSSDEAALEIVLSPARAEPKRLVGTVVDPDGAPVEGAWVGLGSTSTTTSSSGAFVFDLEGGAAGLEFEGHETAPLRAVKKGYLPGEVARPKDGAWPEPLVLRLGGAPLSITGRVVDHEGRPVARAEVWSDEETRFGFVEIDGEGSMRVLATVESILRGHNWIQRGKADDEGRFELAGLVARDYRIVALDQARLIATTVTVAAGTRNVEIRMPKEDLHERVAGRVVSLSGEPVADAEVLLERRSAGAQGVTVERLESVRVRTDADGRFAFQKVSRAVNTANITGADIDLSGFHRPIPPDADVEDLEFVVPLRVHVQIDAGPDAEFDEVAILDAEGKRLNLAIYHGRVAFAMEELSLQQGRSEPFSVSEAGTTLVLYAKGVEARRMPLELERGKLNTIRP